MKKSQSVKSVKVMLILAIAVTMLLTLALVASASTQGLGWESSINTIQESLSGPVVRGIAIIAIVVTGIMFAFGESGSMFKQIAMVALAISIALGAASFVSTVFGDASGVVFLG